MQAKSVTVLKFLLQGHVFEHEGYRYQLSEDQKTAKMSNVGWECPKCHSVWAPMTPGCQTCNLMVKQPMPLANNLCDCSKTPVLHPRTETCIKIN